MGQSERQRERMVGAAKRPFRGAAARALTAAGAALLIPLLASAAARAGDDGTRGKVAGLGISPPGFPQQTTNADLPRIHRMGTNYVALDVWWDFDTANANFVHVGAKTISDPDLALALDQTRAAGFKVILTPKLWCPACLATNGWTWRGRLRPSSPADFFTSYRTMTNHYADIARQHGVDMYFIGSEMSESQWAAGEWRRVASEARERFKGKLAYEVNWDVNDQVRFWDAVDVVGVSAYFPLTDAARPSVDELKSSWHQVRADGYREHRWFDELQGLARLTGKPLLFGEVGYPSAEYVGKSPYDPNGVRQANEQLQADAYRAVLETFQSQPWWMGAIWWEWFPSAGGPVDTSYSPRGKMAETFLTNWYRG